MEYPVDHDFKLEYNEDGFPYFPDNVTEEGNLYKLPNGKYLPSGTYLTRDGGAIIYEPSELSPYADILKQFTK